jgi:signal transduction histidine kinase
MKRGALDYLVKDVQFIEFVPTVVRRALDHITERKQLERQILEISEREQRKFGRDLHDGLGQRLTGLEMLSHGLAKDLKGHDPVLAQQARRLNLELRETVTQARLIAHGLAPIPLEGDGLMHGLLELASSTSRLPGVKCRFLCDPPVCIQDVTTATHLYRIAQEAVNNALKHGRPGKVDITLTERADGLELSVENNGRAMPAAGPANSGMGLNVMRYRAGLIGASLSIKSSQGRGVRIICTLRAKA